VPLDDVLPEYDVRSRHVREIGATPETALAAALGVPIVSDALVAALFRVRGLPTGGTIETFLRSAGFSELERTPTRLVIGAVGRPWTPLGALRPWAATAVPGYVRMAFELAADPEGEARSLLRTETRVASGDARSRRAFRRYWLVVGPFSGFIRQRWLAAAARTVEQ
jgi:hypothetical protein